MEQTLNLYIQFDAKISNYGTVTRIRVKSATSTKPRNPSYPYVKLKMEIPFSVFEPLAEVLVKLDPRDIQVDGITVQKKRGSRAAS